MVAAADIARLLIRLAGQEPGGESMTAMRLHKLLYYCQGWHLAWYGRPLFAEPIEAWKHGPVVPDVWNRPWGQGRDPLPDPGGADDLPADARRAVEQVWRHFRQFSASGLRDRTHQEAPWRDHYRPAADGRCDQTIPPAEMATHFGAEYRRQTGDEPGSAADPRTVSQAQAMRELGW